MTATKTCSKCRQTKPLESFNRRSAVKDGRQSQCRTCSAERKQKWDEENRDHRRNYQQANKSRIAEYRRAYDAANREKIAARAREWWVNNRDSRLEYSRQYYQENREERLRYSQEWKTQNPQSGWESLYRTRAKKFGFEPVIERFTRDDLIAKYGDECWHCGGPFEQLDHHPVPVVRGGAHTQIGRAHV